MGKRIGVQDEAGRSSESGGKEKHDGARREGGRYKGNCKTAQAGVPPRATARSYERVSEPELDFVSDLSRAWKRGSERTETKSGSFSIHSL